MIEKNVLVSQLEQALEEQFGKKTGGENCIPETWAKYPLTWLCYGEREGCIRETSPMWSDDDVMSDIMGLFYTYYKVLVDKISNTPGLDTKALENSIGIYIQPDYSDNCVILIIQRNLSNLVYMAETKAWHMVFRTPAEMENELNDEYEVISKNVK
jgi:hypothetical protein